MGADLAKEWRRAWRIRRTRTGRIGASPLFLVHEEYGTRVGAALGLSAGDVRNLEPLAGQVLTSEDQARLQNLGNNRDAIDPKARGKWTGSVQNTRATAEEVLGTMRNAASVG